MPASLRRNRRTTGAGTSMVIARGGASLPCNGVWSGAVSAEHFARLIEAQHPETEAQLVRHQPAKTYENGFGREVISVEHRARWNATFSAPKSVSLTALVGGDDRVRKAHRDSVRVALVELERYTQARIGNIQVPEGATEWWACGPGILSVLSTSASNRFKRERTWGLKVALSSDRIKAFINKPSLDFENNSGFILTHAAQIKIPRYRRRKSVGVLPVCCLKSRQKYCSSSKPHS